MSKKQKLVPVVTQDYESQEVLMVAYMSEAALMKTLQTGKVHYYSRSRQELWEKGATSGHTQRLRSIHRDCDGDALLVKVEQVGPACHTGQKSCFFETLRSPDDVKWSEGSATFTDTLLGLCEVIEKRRDTVQEGSYVSALLTGGVDRVLKKVAEESGEVLIACKNADRAAMVHELTDLWFHILVLMTQVGISLDDVGLELERRSKIE